MAKPPAESNSNGAWTPVLPSVSQHWREFAANPDAWIILARNLIPVVGVYFFHWSAALAVFNYWFDGLSALAVIIAFLVPRALRESRTKPQRSGAVSEATQTGSYIVRGVLTWAVLVGVIGLPYWIVLIPLHDLLLGNDLRRQITLSYGLWFTFGSMVAGHLWKAMRVDYDAMPDYQLKQRVRWDVYLLVLRAIAMFFMAAHGLVLVPFMSLLLTYFELWPARVLGAVFGDPSRLYKNDPEKPTKPRERNQP